MDRMDGMDVMDVMDVVDVMDGVDGMDVMDGVVDSDLRLLYPAEDQETVVGKRLVGL